MSSISLDYAYSKDFDYRAYLEKKSHFDRIEGAISKQTLDLIANDRELSAAGIEVFENATDSMNESLIGISTTLDEVTLNTRDISRSIDRMSALVSDHLARISIQLTGIGTSLETLIEISRSPEQTWALEQFDVARDAFSRKLTSEALEYVNRSLNGYRDRSGYPLDHRFHILKGLILRGSASEDGWELVDLEKAIESFRTACKYARSVDQKSVTVSLIYQAQCEYALGRIDDAVATLQAAASGESNNPKVHYWLGKLHFRKGRDDLGRDHLDYAIRSDWAWSIRAELDTDFPQIEVRSVVENYQKILASLYQEALKPIIDMQVRSEPDSLEVDRVDGLKISSAWCKDESDLGSGFITRT